MAVFFDPLLGKLRATENNPVVNSLSVTGNHDGASNKVVDVRYGTADPPAPPTNIPDGTLYLKYTA